MGVDNSILFDNPAIATGVSAGETETEACGNARRDESGLEGKEGPVRHKMQAII